jgi:putative sterol carrier protein
VNTVLAYVYREFSENDATSLEAFLKTVFSSFREDNIFSWKYVMNPNFANSIVSIAEKDGKLVGSNYWSFRRLQITKDLAVNAALGADIAVNSKERGQGLGTKLLLYPRTAGIFKKNKIIISYMFSTQELSRKLYRPAAGYIRAPSGTTTYRRLFDCNELKEVFQKIDKAVQSSHELKKKAADASMRLSFKLTGVPEFSINIDPQNIKLDEGNVENPDVVIEGNLPLSSLMLKGDAGVAQIMKAFLFRKVKLKKGFSKIFKIRKVLVLFQEAIILKS